MMNIKKFIYLILLLCCAMSISSANQNDKWKLVKDNNGIQVYTKKAGNSDIVKAKSKTIIKAPMRKVRAKLDDINHRHEWIPFLKISKPLSEYKNNKRIEYSHFYAPWPATDRDFVYLIELVSETDTQLVYEMASVESNLMPVNQDKIRADLFETIYTLKALDKGTTAVELTYHADPKGWIPNWIINIMQRVLPYKILSNLKDELEISVEAEN